MIYLSPVLDTIEVYFSGSEAVALFATGVKTDAELVTLATNIIAAFATLYPRTLPPTPQWHTFPPRRSITLHSCPSLPRFPFE